jgi:signal peptidase I
MRFGLMLMIVATTAIGQDRRFVWALGIFLGCSPRPVLVAEEEAWQQATTLTEHTPDAFVLVGSGQSMQPLYRPGTILVLRHLPFSELQRGQTVVYRNQDKKVVAHVLVSKTRDGWRARGLNNASHDMEPVRADNLVGIVVAAFNPVQGGRTVRLATVR